MLVKVIKRTKLEKPGVWYKSWRRGGNYLSWYRELKEYRSLHRKNLQDLPFIQKYFGKVDTDAGIGMVVEKLCGRDGKLAPTVTEIVRSGGLTDELRGQLVELRDNIIAYNVVFTDVRSNNIVLAHDKHGGRLVVIDGLGDRLWLPVNAMSAKVNQMNRWRHFQRAFEKLEAMDREYSVKRAAL